VIVAEAWYSIPWVDWIGVTGFALTLLGLFVTWRQAKSAADSAEAARQAVTRTEAQIRSNQLLVLIPQLRWVAAELDAAIDGNESIWTRRYLDSWRWHASNIRGLLSVADSEQKKILRALQDSVSQAANAGDQLRSGKAPVSDATRLARTHIGRVCDHLTAWVSARATDTTIADSRSDSE